MKNKLAYSELTKKVYWLGDKNGKIDVTDNFLEIVKLIKADYPKLLQLPAAQPPQP